jgi:chemotaxis protein MotB
MRARTDGKGNTKVEIHVHKEEVVEEEGHGGSWKVAYADFVTAMMAFFLLMWLINATTDAQRKGLADYFSPNSLLSHASSGTGQPFGGSTPFVEGAMVSDRGAEQVTKGDRPAVDRVADEDDSELIAQPRPYRADTPSKAADQGGRGAPAAKPVARPGAQTEPQGARAPTEAELRAEQERREKQAFDRAAQQIRDAVRNDPTLAQLANQLAIDLTPEGLRIQLLDEADQPMFAFGSAVPNERVRLLLQKVAPVLSRLSQDISIAGHTDAAQFSGTDRTNWELSADRANATRRLLVDNGLQLQRVRSVTGNADRDLLVPSDPLAAANRRIAIVVLRSTPPTQ